VAQCNGGDNDDDCTDGLNAALASPPGSTVFVPLLPSGRPWNLRGFKFTGSSIRVVLEQGVVLQALKNESYLYGCEPVADLAV
jgi:hypothetical protein